MLKKNLSEKLPLVLLIAAIGLSPSFIVGKIGEARLIEIRIEDFLILILGLVWLANFLISGRKNFKKIPLLAPILVWVSIGLFSTLANWIFGNLDYSRGFFYFFKELEFFFLYFYVFYRIKSLETVKFLIKTWLVMGLLNVGWVFYQIFYQLLRGSRVQPFFWGSIRAGEEGSSAIGEWGVFPTGTFFLLLFIFLFNIFLYYFLNLNISNFKKGILGMAIASLSVGVFCSLSRTSLFGIILVLLLTICLLFFRKKDSRPFSRTILILVLIITPFFFVIEKFPNMTTVLKTMRVSQIPITYLKSRIEPVIGPQLGDFFYHLYHSPLVYFFGLGKGYVGEAHNQYLRNFIETGIVGSVIFLFMIFNLLKIAFSRFLKNQDFLSVGLSAGLFVATLTLLFASLAAEAFIVVKPSEVFWFFTAMTMAVLTLKEKEKEAKTALK